MDRKEFLNTLGMTSAGLFIATCMGACKKDSTSSSEAPVVDFTLDLTQAANAALNTVGGFVYNSGVIVAKTSSGFIAVSQTCTHESVTVDFLSSTNSFKCSRHGATFSSSGTVTAGPATKALKQYATTLTGNNLRVNG